MSVTIIGTRKGKTKDNSDAFMYYFSEPFTDYEASNGECLGSKCGSEYSRQDFGVKPGDVVDLIYSKGFQDKAVLSGMTIVKRKQQ